MKLTARRIRWYVIGVLLLPIPIYWGFKLWFKGLPLGYAIWVSLGAWMEVANEGPEGGKK